MLLAFKAQDINMRSFHDFFEQLASYPFVTQTELFELKIMQDEQVQRSSRLVYLNKHQPSADDINQLAGFKKMQRLLDLLCSKISLEKQDVNIHRLIDALELDTEEDDFLVFVIQEWSDQLFKHFQHETNPLEVLVPLVKDFDSVVFSASFILFLIKRGYSKKFIFGSSYLHHIIAERCNDLEAVSMIYELLDAVAEVDELKQLLVEVSQYSAQIPRLPHLALDGSRANSTAALWRTKFIKSVQPITPSADNWRALYDFFGIQLVLYCLQTENVQPAVIKKQCELVLNSFSLDQLKNIYFSIQNCVAQEKREDLYKTLGKILRLDLQQNLLKEQVVSIWILLASQFALYELLDKNLLQEKLLSTKISSHDVPYIISLVFSSPFKAHHTEMYRLLFEYYMQNVHVEMNEDIRWILSRQPYVISRCREEAQRYADEIRQCIDANIQGPLTTENHFLISEQYRLSCFFIKRLAEFRIEKFNVPETSYEITALILRALAHRGELPSWEELSIMHPALNDAMYSDEQREKAKQRIVLECLVNIDDAAMITAFQNKYRVKLLSELCVGDSLLILRGLLAGNKALTNAYAKYYASDEQRNYLIGVINQHLKSRHYNHLLVYLLDKIKDKVVTPGAFIVALRLYPVKDRVLALTDLALKREGNFDSHQENTLVHLLVTEESLWIDVMSELSHEACTQVLCVTNVKGDTPLHHLTHHKVELMPVILKSYLDNNLFGVLEQKNKEGRTVLGCLLCEQFLPTSLLGLTALVEAHKELKKPICWDNGQLISLYLVALSYTGTMPLIYNLLSIDERFDLVKRWMPYMQWPDYLPAIKKILEYKAQSMEISLLDKATASKKRKSTHAFFLPEGDSYTDLKTLMEQLSQLEVTRLDI